jgi:hypothetical protein
VSARGGLTHKSKIPVSARLNQRTNEGLELRDESTTPALSVRRPTGASPQQYSDTPAVFQAARQLYSVRYSQLFQRFFLYFGYLTVPLLTDIKVILLSQPYKSIDSNEQTIIPLRYGLLGCRNSYLRRFFLAKQHCIC